MRYFTKELWAADQIRLGGRNAGHWRMALRSYREQLETLRPRLPSQVFAFFDRADIHDGELVHMDVADGSRAAPARHPVRVELAIRDVYDRLVWTLRYAGIRRVLVDFPSAKPLFHHDGEGFGDLGYHELTDGGGGFFRHEILFASGATLLVEFRDVDVRSRARGPGGAPSGA
jgi:hypothetical protein